MVKQAICLAAIVASASGMSLGDITYDARGKTITVTGFSSETPGTLRDVYQAAKEKRWGVVAYNEAAQGYTVRASLVIGSNDGTSTWFRIGAAERPREALVLQGDLKVVEPKKAAGYRQYAAHNVLWIGDESNEKIAPSVRFDCQKGGQYGLFVEDGNELRISHVTLGGASRDRKRLARCEVKCGDVRIADSTIEWVGAGSVLEYSSLDRSGAGVKGVIFQHGSLAIGNGVHWVEDCVFRDLDVGVGDHGSVDATLVRCKFEGNKRNWELGVTQFGIVAIECTFGPEKDSGPHLRRGRIGQGPWQHPRFIAKRHLMVKVTDGAGKPIPGALVTVSESHGKLEAVEHGAAKTDKDGKTPAPFEYGALLVVDHGYKATDQAPKPDSPDCRVQRYDYRYDLRVSAEGYEDAAIKGLDPNQSWLGRVVPLRKR